MAFTPPFGAALLKEMAMDDHRFDAFTRTLASGATRRAFMRGLAGSGAGALIGVVPGRRVRAAIQPEGEGTGVSSQPGCTETDCPAGRVFSTEACACVCDVVCRPNFALDSTSCNCYCTLGDFYVCPRVDQVYDDNACECVCAIEDCPGDAILDPVSCGCFCPAGIVCEAGEEIDPTTCECVCNRTCDAPFVLDDCVCVCGIEECDPSFIFDETGCRCICEVECEDPFVLDPGTCECVCPTAPACLNPKVFDADVCACVCPDDIACTGGKVPDPETCACVCPPDLACEDPKTLDTASCECVCPVAAACTAPKVEDPETCECVCPPEMACTADRSLNPETCECDCPAGTGLCNEVCVDLCLPTEAYDVDCRCEPIVCPPDRVLTCTCACPPGLAECNGSCLPACGPNQVFDDACRCACRPNISCGDGLTFDPATCGCICAETACPAGKVLDEQTCGCICSPNQSCLAEQKLDPETCRCICDVAPCPAGRELNSRCQCVCPRNIACRQGETLDPATCRCSCAPGSVIETVMVPCGGATVSSTTSLQAGVAYTLRASGTCRLGPNNTGDAEYAFQTINPADPRWLIGFCSGVKLGVGINDPTIDGAKTPNWGAYTTAHIYTTSFTGVGAPISLNYHDCFYPDNVGSIMVEILCPGTPVGDPVGTGTGVGTPVCDLECPAGRTLDPQACTCVCAATTCSAPYQLNPETCECGCPPALTCPAGEVVDQATCTCGCKPGTLMETIRVPCSGASVPSAATLKAGTHYTIRSSGTCAIGYVLPIADDADAEYAFRPTDPTNLGWVIDRCPGNSQIELGIGIDDVTFSPTKTPNWGPYNPAHVYAIDFVGTGAPISLNYHDCVHRDNVGSLTIEIFCPGTSVGTPVGTGTGTVSDIPGDPACNVTCPPGRKLDPEACACVCADFTCPGPREPDLETCECVCPSSIICPDGEVVNESTCACGCVPGTVFETITVPCTSSTAVKSTTTLKQGVHYTLRASGTCLNGQYPIDAEYLNGSNDPTNVSYIRDRCGPTYGNIEWGIGIDDATIDSTKTPHWGNYSIPHNYQVDFLGKGAPINLNYHDCRYDDNSGSLTVEIVCPEPSRDAAAHNSSA